MSAHRKPKGEIVFDEYDQPSVISSGHRKPKASAVFGGVEQRAGYGIREGGDKTIDSDLH